MSKTKFFAELDKIEDPFLGFLMDEREGFMSIRARIANREDDEKIYKYFSGPTTEITDSLTDPNGIYVTHLEKERAYKSKYKKWYNDYKTIHSRN